MIDENISELCITEIADAGYYKSDDLLAINTYNVNALVPKPISIFFHNVTQI